MIRINSVETILERLNKLPKELQVIFIEDWYEAGVNRLQVLERAKNKGAA